MAAASTSTSTPLESFKKEMTNVNQEYFGQLIGKSGSRKKEIELQFKPESNLKIRCDNKKSMIVVTANDSQAVGKCEQILILLIKEIETTGQLNRRSVLRSFCKLNKTSMTTYIDPNNNNEATYSYSLYIPKRYKGRVIGSGGKNVDWILNGYGEDVSIDIDDGDEFGAHNVFISSDDPEICESAYCRLREFCNSLNSSSAGNKGHKARVSGNLV